MKFPVMSLVQKQDRKGLERLSCNSYQVSWAPQCYSCRIEYDLQETQWNHSKQKGTPGVWIEKRWAVE